MLKYATMCAALAAGLCCAAEKDNAKPKPKGKKPNVLALMKPADDLMEEAQGSYEDGDSKKAVRLYRQAIEKLADVEQEHSAWAAAPEFAPLRLRKAVCDREVDRITMEDAQTLSRMMTVTDTSELEKKREERKKAIGVDPEAIEPLKLGSKGGDAAMTVITAAVATAEGETGGKVQIDEELEWAKDMIQLGHFEEVERSLIKVLRTAPENREAQFLMALSRVRQGRSADALVMLDGLLADNATDESALLLAAGAHMAMRSYSKAIDMLDRAMKTNPKRPDALINMAWLLLEMRPNDTADAEQYYRMAVRMGAARVREMEKRLGIRQE